METGISIEVEKMVLITEEWKTKTRRRTFYYFYDGNKLIHISKIPEVKKIDEINDEKLHTVTYEIPENSIKFLVEFSTTNKAGFLGYRKCILNNGHITYIDEKLTIKFTDFDINNELKKEIEQMEDIINLMINDVKKFYNEFIDENIVTSMTRTNEYFSNFEEGLIFSLFFPNDNMRKKSFENSVKFIHQIWISILIAKLLDSKKIIHSYFQQGTRKEDHPSLIFKNDSDLYYLWHEYQYIGPAPSNYENYISSFFGDSTMWRRRDILVIKSENKETDYLKVKGNDFSKANLVIECKHLPPEKWLSNDKDFENLLNTLKIYKNLPPNTNNILLISLFLIPSLYKNKLEKEGIRVIDNLQPNNIDKIIEFKNYLIKIFT